MSKLENEMFQALHPDPTKQGTRVTKATYDAYHAALLEIIPKEEGGIPFGDLSKVVVPHLPDGLADRTSPGWWVTTVKLDMEARGEIERFKSNGKQHVRQVLKKR